jgi:hypothetical protein
MVVLASTVLFAAIAAAGLAVNNAMEAAGGKCERDKLSIKCELVW